MNGNIEVMATHKSAHVMVCRMMYQHINPYVATT
jgi:hypothetical protein